MTAAKIICRSCLEERDEPGDDMARSQRLREYPRQPVPLCEGCLRVRFCLDMLQEAQNLVEKSMQMICPVNGFADEWTALSEPYDAVKKAWYMVEARRQGLRPVCSCGSDLVATGRCPAGHLICNGCTDSHEDCGG